MRRLLLLVTLPFLVDVFVAYALARAQPVSVVRVAGLAIPVPCPGGYAQPVFFDWDQPGLSEHARARLASAIASAGRTGGVTLSIEATDSNTGDAYEAALRRARLDNITAALVQDGVEEARIVRETGGLLRVLPPVLSRSPVLGSARATLRSGIWWLGSRLDRLDSFCLVLPATPASGLVEPAQIRAST